MLVLHSCPARCGARRQCRTAKLSAAPCLPSILTGSCRAVSGLGARPFDTPDARASVMRLRHRPQAIDPSTRAALEERIRRRIYADSGRHRQLVPAETKRAAEVT